MEERGVLVAGAKDRFVTGADRVGVDGSVGDHDEVGQKRAVGVAQRQVALVGAHDGGQHSLGQP